MTTPRGFTSFSQRRRRIVFRVLFQQTNKTKKKEKSIISALKVAASKCEFEQINFVVGNRGSVVESDFCTKLKKLDVQEGKQRQALCRSCDTALAVMRSAQSGDCVLPPAGARRCKANHRGIEG